MDIQKIKVSIKQTDPRAVMPRYGTEYAAGADLYAVADDTIRIAPGETVFVHTGVSMAIPDGLVGIVAARSGLACKKGLAPANKVGVIDSDYRGEIMVALHNHSNELCQIEHGDRIAQIMFLPYFAAEFELVPELNDTERGNGGFGSTGKN